MSARERMRPLLERLSQVDWLRAGQRFATFAREIRGDEHDDIESDHKRELARGQKLRESAEAFAQQVKGRAS